MVEKKALVTRPEHDKVTRYLSEWSAEVINYANKNAIKIIDLGADKVTAGIFASYLKKQSPKLVLINGHGSPDEVAGHKDKTILKKGKNEGLLKNKIAYVLSCHSALELGPAAVKKGAKAFIGYNSPFVFLTDKNKECILEEDNLANIFKEPSNIISLSLIQGDTVEKAHQKSQEKYKELIKYYGSSNVTPEAKEIRFWLFWNMQSQVTIGEGAACF